MPRQSAHTHVPPYTSTPTACVVRYTVSSPRSTQSKNDANDIDCLQPRPNESVCPARFSTLKGAEPCKARACAGMEEN
eukprot:67490-Chlamydomonas_euryale.AAC.1